MGNRFLPGVIWHGYEDDHKPLIPRLRMSEANPLHPYMPSCHGQVQIYLFILRNYPILKHIITQLTSMLLADTFSNCRDSLLKFSPSAQRARCSDSWASILFRLFLTAVNASSFLEDISEVCNEVHNEINELNPQTVSFCLVPELHIKPYFKHLFLSSALSTL